SNQFPKLQSYSKISMNTILCRVFIVLAMFVFTSDAFNFLGGYDGDKQAIKRPHPKSHPNFFEKLGEDVGKFWKDLFGDKHKKPQGGDDDDDLKKKSTTIPDMKGKVNKMPTGSEVEAMLTKALYTQFKAYTMMADAYRLLGDSVRIQKEVLADINNPGLDKSHTSRFMY
ncbi:hypothetical protein Ahia01_000721100, partial [Argonauta hians]